MAPTTTERQSIPARLAHCLEECLGHRRYAMWFNESVRFAYDEAAAALALHVPNQFVCDWIGKHFRQEILLAAKEVVGREVSFELVIDAGLASVAQRLLDEHEAGESAATAAAEGGAAAGGSAADGAAGAAVRAAGATGSSGGAMAAAPGAGRAAPSSQRRGMHTMPLRFRLDTFVVGTSNEFAYSTAMRLVDEEPYAGGPLFIHGVCGLGKTHLLQGICRRMLERRPEARVLYTTGEQFTNDFIAAVQGNHLESFRRRVRQLDLLALDDVHFLAAKKQTQEEFLHCFDEIGMIGARLALASDSHPKLIRQFSDALTSRCLSGTVAQIQKPDQATRVKIIEDLAARRGMPVLPATVDELAAYCQGSIREIVGVLNKLHALWKMEWPSADKPAEPVGHRLVQTMMASESVQRRTRPVTFDEILSVVVENLGVPKARILSSGRQRQVVLARSLAVYLARQLTSMSFPEIGLAMGKTSHTTALTASRRMEELIEQKAEVRLPVTMEVLAVTTLVDRMRAALQYG